MRYQITYAKEMNPAKEMGISEYLKFDENRRNVEFTIDLIEEWDEEESPTEAIISQRKLLKWIDYTRWN